MTSIELDFWGLAAAAVAGAVVVVFARDMIRVLAGLGMFLFAVAGYFVLYRMTFLAAAQVFVYIGGVLVMMIFAIMAIRRDAGGRPSLKSRFDASAVVIAVGLFALLNWSLGPSAPSLDVLTAVDDPVGDLAETLLGPMLVHFEMLGVLLLTALVAVLAVVGGRRRS